MIVLEHDAGVLRRGDRLFHALDPDEQRVVLTHWHKRHAGAIDGTTSEALTLSDAVALLHRVRGKPRTTSDEAATQEATVRHLEALRDRAVQREAGPARVAPVGCQRVDG